MNHRVQYWSKSAFWGATPAIEMLRLDPDQFLYRFTHLPLLELEQWRPSTAWRNLTGHKFDGVAFGDLPTEEQELITHVAKIFNANPNNPVAFRTFYMEMLAKQFDNEGIHVTNAFSLLSDFMTEVLDDTIHYAEKVRGEFRRPRRGSQKRLAMGQRAYDERLDEMLRPLDRYSKIIGAQLKILHEAQTEEAKDAARKVLQTKLREWVRFYLMLPGAFDDLAHQVGFTPAYELDIIPTDFNLVTQDFLQQRG